MLLILLLLFTSKRLELKYLTLKASLRQILHEFHVAKLCLGATDHHLWWLELCAGTGWAAAAARSSFHRQHGGEVIIQLPTGLESCKRETADTGTGGAETWTFLLTWLARHLGLSPQIPNRPTTNKFKDPISPKGTRADTQMLLISF